VIAEPPVSTGADHDNDTWVLPAVPDKPVGAPGVVTGTAEAIPEAVPVPTALIAETLNVYVAPLVNPVAEYVVPVEPVSATTVDQLTPASTDDSTM